MLKLPLPCPLPLWMSEKLPHPLSRPNSMYELIGTFFEKKVHCKRCITPKLVPPHDPFKECLTTYIHIIQYEAKLSGSLVLDS